VPDARRPYSRAHGVTVDQQPVNLCVDGSHHIGSKYDDFPGRNGLPWGACLNSSKNTGIAANCELRFIASPSFEIHREASRKLGNSNNKQGFIFTKRPIREGEELRWAYNIMQGYRNVEAPITPPPPTRPASKRPSNRSLAPLRPSPNADVAAEDPDCVCSSAEKCKLGHCWGFNRVIDYGKRIKHAPARH
jgi:hypothetical protein